MVVKESFFLRFFSLFLPLLYVMLLIFFSYSSAQTIKASKVFVSTKQKNKIRGEKQHKKVAGKNWPVDTNLY